MPTYTDPVIINGSTDAEQLVVRGNTTQTKALQEWRQDGSTLYGRVTNDGRLQVGSFTSGAMDTDASLIEAHRSAADSTKPKRGLHLKGVLTGTLNAIVTWVVQELLLQGTAGISALHTALRVRIRNENTGTMTGAELRAGDVVVENKGGNAGSAVPQMTGLRVGVSNESGGYAQTAYGLKVEMTNAGQLTNAYAIYTDTGLIHIEDALELKRLLVAPATPATNHVRIYGKSDGRLYARNWQGTDYSMTLPKRGEIDFGPLGTRSMTFTIYDPDLTSANHVTAVQSGTSATGRAQDENEMDALSLRCVVSAPYMTVYADSLFGPVSGKYVIDYLIQ